MKIVGRLLFHFERPQPRKIAISERPRPSTTASTDKHGCVPSTFRERETELTQVF